jgi:hypothetical protein
MSNHALSFSASTYRWLCQSALVSLLAATHWASGATWRWSPIGLSWQVPAAYAQTFTNEEIKVYAESVLEMDDSRVQAYSEVSDVLTSAGYDVTEYDLTCSNAQSLSDVPRAVRRRVRTILVNYCNEARQIVEENGLTVQRFNALTQAHQEDPELTQRIQSEIVTLQQQ